MTTRPTTGGGKFKKVGETFEWLGKAYFPWTDDEWKGLKFWDLNKVARCGFAYSILAGTVLYGVGLGFGSDTVKPNNVISITDPKIHLFNLGVHSNRAVKRTAGKTVEEWNSQLSTPDKDQTARQQIK